MKKLKFSDIKEEVRYEWDCPECGEENFNVKIREELYCWGCDEWIEVEVEGTEDKVIKVMVIG